MGNMSRRSVTVTKPLRGRCHRPRSNQGVQTRGLESGRTRRDFTLRRRSRPTPGTTTRRSCSRPDGIRRRCCRRTSVVDRLIAGIAGDERAGHEPPAESAPGVAAGAPLGSAVLAPVPRVVIQRECDAPAAAALRLEERHRVVEGSGAYTSPKSRRNSRRSGEGSPRAPCSGAPPEVDRRVRGHLPPPE